jgi:hypothetical protein
MCCATAVTVSMILVLACVPDGSEDPMADDTAPPAGSPGPDTLPAALAATRAVERARIELVTTISGPEGPLRIVHQAAFDRGGDRAEAASDMSAVAAALEEAGQPLDGDWTHPTRVVLDADTVYSQLGPMAEELGRRPTDWTRVPLLSVMAQGVTDNDALALVLDPIGPLDLLGRRAIEVGAVGREDVRGVGTTHLRASLALVGDMPDGATGPSAGSLEGRLQAAGAEVLPIDVWVDDESVVRRLEVSLDEALAGRSGSTGLTTTFELYDVGGEVEVGIPDDADVIHVG